MMGLDVHWDTYPELAHTLKTGEPAGYMVQTAIAAT